MGDGFTWDGAPIEIYKDAGNVSAFGPVVREVFSQRRR
jgi:hypothetical protein